MTQMIEVWCEWDINQDYYIFKDAASARAWAVESLQDNGIEESFDELLREGLIGFKNRSVVK